MINIPQKLKEVRIKAGLTQQELAERLEWGRRLVSDYETGRRHAKWTTIEKWYKACGFDIVDFKIEEIEKDNKNETNS